VLVAEGYLVYKLVGQVIEEDISFGEGVVYVALLFSATAIMVAHANDLIGPVLGLSVTAFVLLRGALENLLNQSLISALQAQDVQEAEQVLRSRQDAPYAYRKIGEVLFEQKQYEEALSYLKHAAGEGKDLELAWKMKYCEDQIRLREEKLQVCPRCMKEIPAGERICPQCGHYLGLRLGELAAELAPVWGGVLLVGGVATIVWLVLLVTGLSPWLGTVGLVPVALVAVLKRKSLSGMRHRPGKL
jgi:tetratricopeptide (TPR) repeat protein